MKKAAFFRFCLLLSPLLMTVQAHAEEVEKTSPALSYELRGNDSSNTICFDNTPEGRCSGNMHFILYSKQDGIKVYEQWNSWGHATRSFTASDLLGHDLKTYTFKRRDGVWGKNVPSTVTLNRGEFLITDINPCDGTWFVNPKLPKVPFVYLSITPHFEIKADSGSRDTGVWTGHIQGPPRAIYILQGGIAQLNRARGGD